MTVRIGPTVHAAGCTLPGMTWQEAIRGLPVLGYCPCGATERRWLAPPMQNFPPPGARGWRAANDRRAAQDEAMRHRRLDNETQTRKAA